MTYDDSNVFAKILRGELPCHKVYEDDETFAFMDIMPRANGHTLVIPRTPALNIFDVQADTLCTLIRTVHKLAPAVRDAMDAEGILIQQFNETAAGQMVFHIHFHIIPRWEDTVLRPHTGEMEDSEVLAANAEKIRSALEGS
ncbi:MAG TPA: HIT family protein [Rhizobiales bacterium]|nr:HIT-like protein [bacterium BMS3Bbin10]HDO52977.1 HIT family protein [Hyphomicrobiales bacterium]